MSDDAPTVPRLRLQARIEPDLLERRRRPVFLPVLVNGHLMRFESDKIPDPQPGEAEVIDQGGATINAGVFMSISLRRLTKESFDALKVTADDWMEETTEDTLVLPVTALVVRHATAEEAKEVLVSYR